jgi:hypothetical protein
MGNVLNEPAAEQTIVARELRERVLRDALLVHRGPYRAGRVNATVRRT